MTGVPVAAEADVAAERDRIAWNLPRRPVVEVPRVSPDSPTPDPLHELASGSSWTDKSKPVTPESTAADTWADDGGTTQ